MNGYNNNNSSGGFGGNSGGDGGGNGGGFGGNRGGGGGFRRDENSPADLLKSKLSDADMRIFIGNPKRFEADGDKLPIIVIDSWKKGEEFILITVEDTDVNDNPAFNAMAAQGIEITGNKEVKDGFTWITYTV